MASMKDTSTGREERQCMHAFLRMHQRVITPYLQGDPGNDVHRVDHVTQGFAHLSAVRVSHHRVQIYLQEICALITNEPRASTEPDLHVLLLSRLQLG